MMKDKFEKCSKTLSALLLGFIFIAANFALADQKIKTKSNIKNDGAAASSSSSASSVRAKESQ